MEPSELLAAMAYGEARFTNDIDLVVRLQAEQIEFDYLAEWVGRLGVADEWQLAMSRMPSAGK